MAGLAFFDDRIDIEVKSKMVVNLQLPQSSNSVKILHCPPKMLIAQSRWSGILIMYNKENLGLLWSSSGKWTSKGWTVSGRGADLLASQGGRHMQQCYLQELGAGGPICPFKT
jgi:hypothetical protein